MIDRKIITLLEVNECQSFVKAANHLSLTQPAVSQQIKALEEELGIKIFERRNGKLLVTEQGELAIEYAKKMVGLDKMMRRRLRDGKSKFQHLTVGVTHTAESNSIAEALAKYCAQAEGMTIKIISDVINNLYNMLNSYEIDMAIVEGRIPDSNIKHMILDTDYLVLAVSVDHPLASRSLVTLSELKKEKLILRLPNSGTRNLFAAHLESNNMNIDDFDVILEVDNVATIKDLVRRNFGVSILSKSVCLDELKKGKIAVMPVENLSMMREINIAYREDFTQFGVLQSIVKFYNETQKMYR